MPKSNFSTPDQELTAELARELLSYDPATGQFLWKIPGKGRQMHRQVGCISNRGYLRIVINRRTYPSHRIAWLISYGKWPADQIDHINCVKHDNRLANLREATSTTNGENQRRAQSDNKCGVLGVEAAPNGKFRSRIKTGGRLIHLGSFATPEEAHQVYLQAKRRLHAGNTL